MVALWNCKQFPSQSSESAEIIDRSKRGNNCNSNVSSTPNRDGQQQIHEIRVGHKRQRPKTETVQENLNISKYQSQTKKHQKHASNPVFSSFYKQNANFAGFPINCRESNRITIIEKHEQHDRVGISKKGYEKQLNAQNFYC